MYKEILKEILMSDDVVESVQENSWELFSILPELKAMVKFPHNHPHHHLDVWNHTLLALSMAPEDFEVRLALLLHDIGKPFCYQDEEVRRFRGHPKKSAEIADKVLNRLGFSPDERKRYKYLIANHDTPIQKVEMDSFVWDRTLPEKLFQLQCCDGLAHHPAKLEKRKEYLTEAYHYVYSGTPDIRFQDWLNHNPANAKVLQRERGE